MTDSERLKLVIELSKMTPNEFAKSLGYERAMIIYNVLNGKSAISIKLCATICTKYPEISYQWLLKGLGNMILKPNSRQENNNIILDESIINQNKYTEIMTPDRFDRLLTLMEDQQRAINQLIENQNVLAHKIPNYTNEHILGGASGLPA